MTDALTLVAFAFLCYAVYRVYRRPGARARARYLGLMTALLAVATLFDAIIEHRVVISFNTLYLSQVAFAARDHRREPGHCGASPCAWRSSCRCTARTWTSSSRRACASSTRPTPSSSSRPGSGASRRRRCAAGRRSWTPCSAWRRSSPGAPRWPRRSTRRPPPSPGSSRRATPASGCSPTVTPDAAERADPVLGRERHGRCRVRRRGRPGRSPPSTSPCPPRRCTTAS